jgi:hypothetical protein
MNEEWKQDFDRTSNETVRLLEEWRKDGYAYKRVADTRFVECDGPTWNGTSDEEGLVTIDPAKHEPRCIAHLMGRGFHECLWRDLPTLWHNDEDECETIAETVRYFVELRMNRFKGKRWLPRAKHSTIIEACDYMLGGPTGFYTMLQNHWTIDQLLEQKAALAAFQLTPEYRAIMRMREQSEIGRLRQMLGRHVVVVFRRGGRIKEEKRYDSESESLDEVTGVYTSILGAMPIGASMIGKGWIGFLPWEMELFRRGTITEEQRFNLQCPVRVADVVENAQTDITTVYLESV